MSSEQLADGVNPLDAELAATWDILKGYSGRDTDLGIARRFGGAAAAYSLRDIGAMNGSVVRVRREPTDTTAGIDDEERFSANQVSSGALEDWVNGKLESTLPADVATAAAAYSLRKVSEGSLVYTGDYSSGTDTISANTGNITVTGNNDGIFGKDNVLKIENDDRAVPQLQTSNSNYQSSTSGVVEFEYYVPSDHPIVGNYWHIGTNRTSGGQEIAYSKRGVKIVGGAWTTAKLFYGSLYGGTDKPTTFSTNGRRLITILDQEIADGIAVTISCEDGDLYYISSLTIKTYDAKAVRIRRSSDNIEVDVAFDSDNKVSASSAITNVAEQGGEIMDTSATTLGDFISYRDNIIGNSEFNTAANLGFNDGGTAAPLWDKAGGSAGTATFTSNTTETTDPNGGNTAAKYEWGTGSGAGTNWLRQETELAGGVEVTFSAYYKQLGSQTTVRHNYWKGNSDVNVVLDFSNGTISEAPSGGTAPTSSAVQNVGNGWYRVSMVLTTVAATIENKAQPARQPVGVTGGGVYVWGAMLEVGNTLGTYVKTTSEIPNGVALVHTWYDQAGSNNAVQETATYQPKIAENGALLADGIDFDGSDNYLTLSSALGATTNQSIFTVLKSDNLESSSTGYVFDNRDSGSDGSLLYLGNGDFRYLVNSQVTVGELTTTTEVLVSAINNSSNGKIARNAVQSTSATGGALNVTTAPRIGATSYAAAPSSNHYDGTIKEIVVYNSDQSDNRFKIESNINNYYGLYNDANEWDLDTNPAWTSNASSGFTANGTDGFTITTSGTSIQQFKLRVLTTESPTDSDYFKVSFNNNDPDGLITNAQLRITSFGSGGSATTISNGFNALDIINNGGFTFAYFSINANGGGSSKTATISNFKISRIARNGFVETWYDQSGNNRPMIQASASEQPSIVENGGFVGGVKADAATSNDTMQNLQVSTDGTTANFGTNSWANGGTKLGLIYVGKVLSGTTSSNPAPFWGAGRGVSQYQTGAVSFQVIKGGNDSFRLVNERQDLSPDSMTTSLTLNSDDDIIVTGTTDNRDFTLTVNASSNSETESADLDVRETTPISLFGSYDKNAGRYYQRSSAGVCKECYLFSGDNISEVDTIATEINKHYNIY